MENGNIVSPPEANKVLSLIARVDKKSFFGKHVRPPARVRLIHGGGSDRRFYRVQGQEGSVILMISLSDDGDFTNYLEIARFLKDIGIGVPALYDSNPEEHYLFMEDVGDASLYRESQKGMTPQETIFWYKRILETLVHMQVEGGKKWRDCPILHHRTFDYHALRWETEYFQQYFLERYCGIAIPEQEELDQEFKALAKKVSVEPFYFMHRDFQSQNIMLHSGSPKVLDFQGARRGLLHYDLASLLKDAYVVLPANIRNELLTFYRGKLGEKGIETNDYEQFYEIFTLAGLQRNMQALGAFSYLSLIKGKSWFDQYIPAGVQHLHLGLQDSSDFPLLSSLVKRILPLV